MNGQRIQLLREELRIVWPASRYRETGVVVMEVSVVEMGGEGGLA
jgi:hypothetical protein